MKCYLLIGGASSRMGRSKVDHPFGGSTFLRRISTAAKPVFDDVIAVQRAGGRAANGTTTIYEEPHELQAPVFGLWTALQNAGDRCFVLAIDYPLITSEVLRYLASRASASAAAMVVPQWNGKLQMLCAGYSPAILPRFAPRIAAGQLNLRGLTEDIEIIPENDLRERFTGEPLMNVNTAEELEEAARFL
ncbi:MAG TPA: molybdenum cofactor guanylyltransferase [Thermoanaerobaculia bacterium]|nr:molybdenum cofactor guanylyltransferase [Thermoanaerobaculia bacterium]